MIHSGGFNIRQVAPTSLKGAFRPSRRLTLLSATHVTGTGTPPAVTLSGSLVQARGVYLECTTGGALGSTVWRHCLDFDDTASLQGFTSSVPGAATIDLGLGLTANLPNSTYTTGDIYRGVISNILGPYGTVFDGITASESVHPHVGYINGRPTLRADGGARNARSTTSTLADFVLGNDLSFTIGGTFQYHGSLTPTNAQTVFSFCNGSAGAPGFFVFSVTPAGAWRCGKRGDTGGTVNCDGGTADNLPHYFTITHTGTAVTLRIDGVVILNAVAQNVATIAGGSGFWWLGHMSVPGLAPTDYPGDVDVGDLYLWNSVLSASQLAIVERSLKNDWGL